MSKSYSEFNKNIRKVHDTREHKVTRSLGVYDAYKYIRKNKWFNIGRPVTEEEFYKIIRMVNQGLAEELVRGAEIHLPERMGDIEIRKKPSRLSIVDGKLVTNLPIDWDATLKLWYEDEESYRDKTIVRVENEEIFKVYYNKTTANYNNKSFYEFRPNRELKKELTKQAKAGRLEAYTFKHYD